MKPRRAISLRISLTKLCERRCVYCRGDGAAAATADSDALSFEEILSFVRLVKSAYDITKIRLTGGEPLGRDDIVRLVRMLADENIPDLALTTNGRQLACYATELHAAGLNRINISLDTIESETFRQITGGAEVAPTLAGIDAALEAGLSPVKLNTVVLRGINDDEVIDIARFGLARGCQVRFLELMPIDVAAHRHDAWFVPSDDVLTKLETAFDMKPLGREDDTASRNFSAKTADGITGIIGFISPCSRPFCSDCRRLRLTASGQLLGCLAQADGIDVRPMLTEDAPRIEEVVEKALCLKETGRHFGDQEPMVRIGG